ncbi:MAG: hypothetical protein QXO22_05375 [Thermosphaera sp.]
MKTSVIKTIIVKDLKETFRDKTFVFWMIAWPLIWLAITAYVFIPPGVDQPMTMSIGLVNYDTSSGFQSMARCLLRP